MPTQQAIGQYNPSQGINTSGSPVPINALGQIIYANFFNAGAINAELGRLYTAGLTCTTDANGCPTFTFFADVGNTPTNPPTFAVRGYPEIILVGSKWGVPGETIQGTFGASQTSSTGTEFVDHSYAIANTGYPAAANAIPNTQICINADEVNHVGAERDVMLESWFYDRCQDTGQGNELIGKFDNNYGTQTQTRQHNNQLLEVMVHHGPINFNDPTFNDSGNGQRNPAQFFCSAPHTIGGQDYEIWYGRNGQNGITLAGTTTTGQSNPSGALVVYNRLGPAGGPYGTDLTNEGDITLDWSGILNHAKNQLQAELIACNAWGNGQLNSQWTNPNSPDNPFSRINDPACGAVGGIEFGLEPQLNGPNDQPVETIVNKLDVVVDGQHIGPTPENCIDEAVTGCGQMSPLTIQGGTTTNVTAAQLGLAAGCTIIQGTWIGGGATVTTQPDNSIDITPATGTTGGNLALQIECDGVTEDCDGWQITVTNTGQALACVTGVLGPFTPGQSIPLTSLVTGGQQPYGISIAPTGPVTGAINQTAVTVSNNASNGPQTFTIGITDNAGNSINCNISITIEGATSSNCKAFPSMLIGDKFEIGDVDQWRVMSTMGCPPAVIEPGKGPYIDEGFLCSGNRPGVYTLRYTTTDDAGNCIDCKTTVCVSNRACSPVLGEIHLREQKPDTLCSDATTEYFYKANGCNCLDHVVEWRRESDGGLHSTGPHAHSLEPLTATCLSPP